MDYTRNLDVPYESISAFCQRYHIQKLSLFGSVLREDFRPDSDVDVLVEFEQGHAPGWEIVSMEHELSVFLGRRIDFKTPQELSRYFRQQVLETSQTIYERA